MYQRSMHGPRIAASRAFPPIGVSGVNMANLRVAFLVLAASFTARADITFGSAYGFLYGHGTYPGGPRVGDYLFIDGPNGRETFDFGFHVDVWAQPFINSYGQLAAHGEATADPFIYFAIYGRGGFVGRFSGGNGAGYQGTLPPDVVFGSLGWPTPAGRGSRPALEGITERGLVFGTLTHRFLDGTVTSERITWQLPDPIPEPASVVLLGTLLLWIGWIYRRRRGA